MAFSELGDSIPGLEVECFSLFGGCSSQTCAHDILIHYVSDILLVHVVVLSKYYVYMDPDTSLIRAPPRRTSATVCGLYASTSAKATGTPRAAASPA